MWAVLTRFGTSLQLVLVTVFWLKSFHRTVSQATFKAHFRPWTPRTKDAAQHLLVGHMRRPLLPVVPGLHLRHPGDDYKNRFGRN
jgi:hypothetical protein